MTDRDLHLFGLLTDVGDDLVEESLIPSTPASANKPRRERRRPGEFWNSPLAAAILSGIVALGVLAGIIVAGQQNLTPGQQPGGQSTDTRFKPFYVGMPYEDMMDKLDGLLYRDSFQYGNTVFVPRIGDEFLLITFDPDAITDIRVYTEKTPTREDFEKIKPGMDMHEVTALVGRPEGSQTSGMITMAYRTAEDDVYYIYWHGEGGTVSEVLWTNPDPVAVYVRYSSHSSEPSRLYTDPEKTVLFHDYFDNLYTSMVYDGSVPGASETLTYTVQITYENGQSVLYEQRGEFQRRDGGKWALIQATQPHVSTTLQELLASTPADEPAVAYMYVSWADADGFCGSINGIQGHVYVQAPNAYKPFATVRIEYVPALLKEQTGTLDGGKGYPGSYTWVITSPVFTRYSNPEAGEPLFG